MYLGRIISAGKTENGQPYVSYRVSSRSFPNRQVNALEDEAIDVQTISEAMMTTAQSLTELAIRFFLNLLVCWILVQFFYYRKSRRRDYYFTFMVFSSAMLMLLL